MTPLPKAPPVPGTMMVRRARNVLAVCVSATFAVWAAAGLSAASAFLCVAGTIAATILNSAQRSLSTSDEDDRS